MQHSLNFEQAATLIKTLHGSLEDRDFYGLHSWRRRSGWDCATHYSAGVALDFTLAVPHGVGDWDGIEDDIERVIRAQLPHLVLVLSDREQDELNEPGSYFTPNGNNRLPYIEVTPVWPCGRARFVSVTCNLDMGLDLEVEVVPLLSLGGTVHTEACDMCQQTHIDYDCATVSADDCRVNDCASKVCLHCNAPMKYYPELEEYRHADPDHGCPCFVAVNDLPPSAPVPVPDTGKRFAELTFDRWRVCGGDYFTMNEFITDNAHEDEVLAWANGLDALAVGETYQIAVHFGYSTIIRTA
jgi:hypothetical protein